MTEIIQGEHYGELQRFIDRIFQDVPEDGELTRLSILSFGEIYDLPSDLMEVLSLLPSGSYHRTKLCTQLNSIVSSHSWSFVYGTVE